MLRGMNTNSDIVRIDIIISKNNILKLVGSVIGILCKNFLKTKGNLLMKFYIIYLLLFILKFSKYFL